MHSDTLVPSLDSNLEVATYFRLHRRCDSRHRSCMDKKQMIPTDSENTLWELLRTNNISGFVQQKRILGYIVDFYNAEKMVAIEVDGPIHRFQKHKDSVRSAILRGNGVKVLRFTNEEIENEPTMVLNKIQAYLDNRKVPQ